MKPAKLHARSLRAIKWPPCPAHTPKRPNETRVPGTIQGSAPRVTGLNRNTSARRGKSEAAHKKEKREPGTTP